VHFRPSDARLHHRAAELALETGEVERAHEYAERACELADDVAAHHATLGRALRRMGEGARARQAFERAQQIDPGDAQAARELDRLRRKSPGRARRGARGGGMRRVSGSDVGTRNSCVAVIDGGKPVVIPNAGGYKTTPSMFAISQDGKRLVGHLAKRQAITNARNTVFASKRLIGRRFDEPEVQRSIELCSYEIVRGANDDPRIVIAGRTFTCPEIAPIGLREIT